VNVAKISVTKKKCFITFDQAAIHSRLQDIVSMVEHAKKSDPELNGEKVSTSITLFFVADIPGK
jgi:hypothetical protein